MPDKPRALARGSQPAFGEMLGRYRIERTLGEGGMGVVYLAFDPDLERKVALKVLRDERVANDARARLLREARALARLAHPNVVTVHEVGSAAGRDFVAMELVDGETLATWLAQRRRPAAEILDVFLAAGRGLAAAHAAGLVHRDFKPNNVLRARDGRVVVTDFGLARGADAERDDDRAPRTSPLVPRSLLQLTATGQVIGTPAYMAPEQWSNGSIGPQADQFAFCVALWEALAGERPFRGDSDAALRAAVMKGGDRLDASRLPRWIRPILVRGLAAAPAQRWRNMEALLVRLVQRRRRPALVAIAALAIVAGGAALAFGAVTRDRDDAAGRAPAVACLARSPAQPRPDLAAQPALAAQLAQASADVQSTLVRACGLPEASRRRALDCLDHVVPRIDAAGRAAVLAGTRGGAAGRAVPPEALAAWLVEPAQCLRATPPHLTLDDGDEVVVALATSLRTFDKHDPASAATAATLAERAADPCARAIAAINRLAIAFQEEHVQPATLLADRCADDAIRAVLALRVARAQLERGGVDEPTAALLAGVATTVARVPQDLLVASEWVLQAAVHEQRDEIAEALVLVGRAIDRFGQRGYEAAQSDAVSLRLRLYLHRAGVADLHAMRREIAAWLPRLDEQAVIADATRADAIARLLLGDVEGAREQLVRVWRDTPRAVGMKRITGRVVDRAGRPVAGATVYASEMLVAAGGGVLPGAPTDVIAATTDAAGNFAIAGGPMRGGVVAFAGTQRSLPAAPGTALRLVLDDTRTIRGRIELAGMPHTRVVAVVTSNALPSGYGVLAPVAADGTFAIEHAPVGAGTLRAVIGFGRATSEVAAEVELAARRDQQTQPTLVLASGERTVYIIVRSSLTAPLTGAVGVIERGTRPHEMKFAEARGRGMPMRMDQAVAPHALPPDVATRIHPGDLVATFPGVPAGRLTACAMAIPPDVQRYQAYADAFDIRCEPLPNAARVVVVSTPPQPRFLD